MYDICNIIYGVPYTEQIDEAVPPDESVSVGDIDPTMLEEHGFTFLYSGNADLTPGYLGICFKSCPSWELEANIIWEMSDDDELKVKTLIEALPQWLKEIVEEPKIQYVWSTS